ncbi:MULTISPECIES: hypothetical protein [unclassified Tenacibaculum]|uniref:hypothetical protein n=1 Tax=unclassified Tenacibaculum TaxID=2635139 RepID=UPI001F3DA267|nr:MULTISPECIES: hypothetical protein [unclassified Tenacibaculum]MCF2874029.1 hypothetical protein [Tenacibaculum sp. Cn5-1]MCF2934610.1 hypothetical protein [Tenacibaculum sp. Cn5-34]MCG7510820.1 hypothetical protein [Tenacibaculum sp. Cn5-46]
MKTKIILLLTAIILTGCNSSEKKHGNIYIKDFSSENPDWKTTKDTISKTLVFEEENFKLPLKVLWVPAIGKDNCLHIGFLKIDRIDSNNKIKISEISTSKLPCALKWESNDQRRFESLVINCKIDTRIGIKAYTFDGSIGTINGIGELTP